MTEGSFVNSESRFASMMPRQLRSCARSIPCMSRTKKTETGKVCEKTRGELIDEFKSMDRSYTNSAYGSGGAGYGLDGNTDARPSPVLGTASAPGGDSEPSCERCSAKELRRLASNIGVRGRRSKKELVKEIDAVRKRKESNPLVALVQSNRQDLCAKPTAAMFMQPQSTATSCPGRTWKSWANLERMWSPGAMAATRKMMTAPKALAAARMRKRTPKARLADLRRKSTPQAKTARRERTRRSVCI